MDAECTRIFAGMGTNEREMPKYEGTRGDGA
jgi:hypothetical protein